MTPYKAFKLFRCLKLHFETQTYDFFKYQGKAKNLGEMEFQARKDFAFYYKLSKIQDLQNYLVANFIQAQGPVWVGQMLSPESQDIYDNWRCRMESFTYNLKREYAQYLQYGTFKGINNITFPEIVNMILRKEISLEVALVIESVHPFIDNMNSEYSWDPVWQSLSLKLTKYRPFFIKSVQEYTGHKYMMRVSA